MNAYIRNGYTVIVLCNYSTQYRVSQCPTLMEAKDILSKALEEDILRFRKEKGYDPVIIDVGETDKIFVCKDRKSWGENDSYRKYDYARYILIEGGPNPAWQEKKPKKRIPTDTVDGQKTVYAKISVSGDYVLELKTDGTEDPDDIAVRAGELLEKEDIDLNKIEDGELFMYTIEDADGKEIWNGGEV